MSTGNDGPQRTFVISFTHQSASVSQAPCHHPSCPNQAEYGIATFFQRGIPLAVVPLCRIHLHRYLDQRQERQEQGK